MSLDLKLNDLLELSKVYAPEYNMPELHDRVLVFDIMRDSWETSAILDVASKDDDSMTVDLKSGESPTIVSNDTAQVQEKIKDEQRRNSVSEVSEGEEANKSESTVDIKAGSTSGEDSCKTLATDETQLVENSSPAEHCEHLEKGPIRQHKIFVHSSWLAVQSKYFRSLFYSGMKESSCNEIHVKVSESEEATHLIFLEAIYKADILNDATVEELLAVLELADKYDVKFVFKKCKYVLQTRVETVDVCKQVMHVIKEKQRLEDVEDLAATMQITMGGTFSPLENHWMTENFTSQSQPFVQYLLASCYLKTGCENTVFQALMHWMEINKVDPESLERDCSLLKCVRFETITIDYLYNVVRVHPIASKMPGFQELMLKGMTYHALPLELRQLLGEVTPRPRQILGADVHQYCWKIYQSQLLTYNTTPIESEVFWLRGYKAQIRIIFYGGSRSNQNYQVRIALLLLDLTAKNHVPLFWKFKGDHQNCISGGVVSCSYNFRQHGNIREVNATFQKNYLGNPMSIQLIVDQAK